MMIFIWILLGIGVYYLFFNNSNSSFKMPNRKSSEEILNERFVNGDIDAETFKTMKETLRK